MGPFNELRQLERKAQVLAVLQQDNLSEWATNYWTVVYNNIALDEDRYNARVAGAFKGVDCSGELERYV